MITTTLKAIRKASPCGLRPAEDGKLIGYLKLKTFLGEGFPDDAPIKFSKIAKSNGLGDAVWCIRSLEGEHLPAVVAFATDMAESVIPIWEDWAKVNAPEYLDAPRKAIEAARNGSPDAAAVLAAAHAAYAADAAACAAHAAFAGYAAASAAAHTAYAAAYDAYYADAAYAAYTSADAAGDDAIKKTQLDLLKKYFS